MRGSEFAELKAFAAVVERASFARAAEHLGLSPSALSQTIRQLEGRLGVRLLNRTTRSVAPTPAGSRLHERIAPMFLEMDAAVAEAVAATGQTAGMLRINTLGMAAKKIIAPRLGRFHRAHPDVTLDIVIDDGLSDIVAGRFDAGIRVGQRLEKDMIAVRLTPDVKMLAAASPGYLARHGSHARLLICTGTPASIGASQAVAGSIVGNSKRRTRNSRLPWKGRSSPITRMSLSKLPCKGSALCTPTTTIVSQMRSRASSSRASSPTGR